MGNHWEKLNQRAMAFFLIGPFVITYVLVAFVGPSLAGSAVTITHLLTGNIAFAVESNERLGPTLLSYILAVIPALLIGILWAYLEYQNFDFRIDQEGFKIKQGVIIKKSTFIPFSKIQNVDLHQDPASRILGITRLKIQTAGYGASAPNFLNFLSLLRQPKPQEPSAEGHLPGISPRRAEEIKDLLLLKVGEGGGKNGYKTS